jgi:hypothetical protein
MILTPLETASFASVDFPRHYVALPDADLIRLLRHLAHIVAAWAVALE